MGSRIEESQIRSRFRRTSTPHYELSSPAERQLAKARVADVVDYNNSANALHYILWLILSTIDCAIARSCWGRLIYGECKALNLRRVSRRVLDQPLNSPLPILPIRQLQYAMTVWAQSTFSQRAT